MDSSDEHDANAANSKTVTQQPRSNVAIASRSHLQKQDREIVVTDAGMQIDRSERQERNKSRAKTETSEFRSNAKYSNLFQ
jgi:hypothetical protein